MRLVLALALCLSLGCQGSSAALTVALGLLPGELATYRAIVADFERATGQRVLVVPQQYPDIRRALRAESVAARGTLDLVELDVYSLAPAANDVRVLDAAA